MADEVVWQIVNGHEKIENDNGKNFSQTFPTKREELGKIQIQSHTETETKKNHFFG